MKNTGQLRWILCCASAWGLATAALAQEYYPSTPQTSTATNGASTSQKFCRSKDLVGANVKDVQGQKLGDISEIYVNAKNGEAFAAIDIGSRRHAIVPVQALHVTPARSTFRNAEVTLNKTKTELEAGPVVTDGNWHKLDDSAFTQNAYSYYTLQSPSGMGGAESPGGASSGSETNQPSSRPMTPKPKEPKQY